LTTKTAGHTNRNQTEWRLFIYCNFLWELITAAYYKNKTILGRSSTKAKTKTKTDFVKK